MYKVAQFEDFHTFEKAQGFSIQNTGVSSPRFSLTYIRLEDTRDPADLDRVISIREGFEGIYLVLEGELLFTFYTKGTHQKVVLKKKEYVHITPGTEYEIEGRGELLLVCLPAWSEKMYFFLKKPVK